jgi:hypothetical protein
MKYHKFNRRGRYDMFALHTFLKSKKKQTYMVNTGRSKLLDSFFFENKYGELSINLGKGISLPKIKGRMTKWNSTHVEFKNANMT